MEVAIDVGESAGKGQGMRMKAPIAARHIDLPRQGDEHELDDVAARQKSPRHRLQSKVPENTRSHLRSAGV